MFVDPVSQLPDGGSRSVPEVPAVGLRVQIQIGTDFGRDREFAPRQTPLARLEGWHCGADRASAAFGQPLVVEQKERRSTPLRCRAA